MIVSFQVFLRDWPKQAYPNVYTVFQFLCEANV